MTTYTTIKEAFKNGTGDVFFTKNNCFVATSRKNDFSYYLNNGFSLLSYEETLALDKAQNVRVEQPKKTISDNLKSIESKMAQSVSTCDGYYDEFPDAYGQNL
jgi:hypothetical protein